MQNEPNSNLVCPELVEGFAHRTSSIKYPESRIEQKMSNKPNLQGGQITHLINEQRTINNKHFTNEPNFDKTNNEQISNEPNLRQI